MDDDFYGDALTGSDIANAASNQLDSSAYQLYNYNDGVHRANPKTISLYPTF